MRRAVYLCAFVILAAAAGLLTLRAQHTVDMVVAAHDVHAGVRLTASDLSIRRVHEDGLPDGATVSVDDAVGRFLAMPLAAGEPLLGRMLSDRRSGSAVVAGLDVPSGYRAVAVPVQPAAAVGGMLASGDRVDVYATAQAGHAGVTVPSGPSAAVTAQGGGGHGAGDAAAAGEGSAVLLGSDVLVLELRSDTGQALDVQSGDTVHGLSFGSGKLGSVVLAVPAEDVDRYAAATAQDTIYLALSVG